MSSDIPLNRKPPEILAPAGNPTCLEAAIQNGCNAVYLGLGHFNMRSRAENFDLQNLDHIIERAHQCNVRVYVTLNTIVFQNELEALETFIQRLSELKTDAVIAWDLATLQSLHRAGIPIHLSTQASSANADAIAFYYRQFGVERVVPARECTLEQLIAIQTSLKEQLNSPPGLEVFAHGAMCLAISGRCMISTFQSGNSANRGRCDQPCRRRYLVQELDTKEQLELTTDTVLSPRDICIVPFIEQVLDAGVASLKIEGRARSPEYVGEVTAVYRKLVDTWAAERDENGFNERFAAQKAESMKRLDRVFHRGFSDGFYMGRPVDEWVQKEDKPRFFKEFVGPVTNYYARPGVAEIRVQDCTFEVRDRLIIQGPTTGSLEQEVLRIEQKGKPLASAKRGEHVGVAVSRRVRRNDRVFILRKRDDLDRHTGSAPAPECGLDQ